MNPADEKVFSGARKILSQCLSLEQGDDLVIFCDESTSDVASWLASAARETGIDYVILFEPMALQPSHDPEEEFRWPTKLILDRTCAILTCLNDRVDCLPFRRRVISQGQGASKRIGHMPGANRLSLAVSDADYEQVRRDCANLACALAQGEEIRLLTKDCEGNPYRLDADLGGWDQMPVASDGFIPLGAWGNIPGGETYIAPLIGTASGHLVVSCALPGLPLFPVKGQPKLPENEVVLHFERGRLVKFDTSSEQLNQWYAELRRQVEIQEDPNWSHLAEIGIGTNKGIGYATGISLIDEKLYGSLHIAIGDNIHHGGTNKSVIHCDMVTFGQIDIDGKTVLADGEVCFDPEEWFDHYSRVELAELPKPRAHLRRTGSKFIVERQRLYKVVSSGSGRLLKLQVGDLVTAKLAAHAFEFVPVDGSYASVESIAKQAGLSEEVLLPVLQLLCNFHLIRCDLLGE